MALREALASVGCGRTIVRVAERKHPDPTCVLGDDADEMMGRATFDLSIGATHLDLALATPLDLGFAADSPPTLGELYRKAAELGLSLCPPEVGPQLRLQYLDQPVGEFLNVAMLPIANYAGEFMSFSVANGGAGLLLIGTDGRPEAAAPIGTKYVFLAGHQSFNSAGK